MRIVIGRVLDLQVSTRTAALAYWHGQYVAIDQDEDAVKLAEVSVPAFASFTNAVRNRKQSDLIISSGRFCAKRTSMCQPLSVGTM